MSLSIVSCALGADEQRGTSVLLLQQPCSNEKSLRSDMSCSHGFTNGSVPVVFILGFILAGESRPCVSLREFGTRQSHREGHFSSLHARCGSGLTRTAHVAPISCHQSMTPVREQNLRSNTVDLTYRRNPGDYYDVVGLLEAGVLQRLEPTKYCLNLLENAIQDGREYVRRSPPRPSQDIMASGSPRQNV